MAALQFNTGRALNPRHMGDESSFEPRRRSRVTNRRPPSHQQSPLWPIVNAPAKQEVGAVDDFRTPSARAFPAAVAAIPTNAAFDGRYHCQQQKIPIDKGHVQNSSHMSPSSPNPRRPSQIHALINELGPRDIVSPPSSSTIFSRVRPTATAPIPDPNSNDDDDSSCSSLDAASFLANVHSAVSKAVVNSRTTTTFNHGTGYGQDLASAHLPTTSTPFLKAVASLDATPVPRHAAANRHLVPPSFSSSHPAFDSQSSKHLLPKPFARPKLIVTKHRRPPNTSGYTAFDSGVDSQSDKDLLPDPFARSALIVTKQPRSPDASASASRPLYEKHGILSPKDTSHLLHPPAFCSTMDFSPPPRPLTPKQLHHPPPRKSSHIHHHHRKSVSVGGIPVEIQASLSNLSTPEKQNPGDTSDSSLGWTPPVRPRITSNSIDSPPIAPLQIKSNVAPGTTHHLLKTNEWDLKLEILQRAIDTGNFDDMMPTLVQWDDDEEEEHGMDEQEVWSDAVVVQQPRKSRLPSTPIVLTSSIVYSSSTCPDNIDRSGHLHHPTRIRKPDPTTHHQSTHSGVDTNLKAAKHNEEIHGTTSTRGPASTLALALNQSDGIVPELGLEIRTIKKSLHTPLLSETLDVAPDVREENFGVRLTNSSSCRSSGSQETPRTDLSRSTSTLSRMPSQSSRLARSRGVPSTLQLDQSCFFGTAKDRTSRLTAQLNPFTDLDRKKPDLLSVPDDPTLPHAPTSPLAPPPVANPEEAFFARLTSAGTSACAPSFASTSRISGRLKKLGRKLGLPNLPAGGSDSSRSSSTMENYPSRASGISDTCRSSFQQRNGMPITRHNTPSFSLDNICEVLDFTGSRVHAPSLGEYSSRSVRTGSVTSLSTTQRPFTQATPRISNDEGKVEISQEQEDQLEHLLDPSEISNTLIDNKTEQKTEEDKVREERMTAEKIRLDDILKNHQANEKLYLENLARNIKNRVHLKS